MLIVVALDIARNFTTDCTHAEPPPISKLWRRICGELICNLERCGAESGGLQTCVSSCNPVAGELYRSFSTVNFVRLNALISVTVLDQSDGILGAAVGRIG